MAREVRIPSGSKLGSNFPPVEVLEIGNPGMPGELIIHNGRLFVYGPNGETYIDGGLIQTEAILVNSITANKLTIGSQKFTHDIQWTAEDEKTISWSSGVIKLTNGDEHQIDPGNESEIFNQESSSPNSPSSSSEEVLGTQDWEDISNIQTQDSNEAWTQFGPLEDGNDISYYIKATNFGFTIPTDKKILGIKVEIRINQEEGLSDEQVIDHQVRIIKNNTIRTANRATFSFLPTSYSYEEYGGETDLWGQRWDADDINSSTFGVAFAFRGILNGGASLEDLVVNIDHVRITIYYGDPAYLYFDGTSVLKITNDISEAISDDKLLLAIVEQGAVGGACVITSINSSGTTIDGSKITTGKIQSADGNTYFDLDNGEILVSDSNDPRVAIGDF
jgi:hypothetical protein